MQNPPPPPIKENTNKQTLVLGWSWVIRGLFTQSIRDRGRWLSSSQASLLFINVSIVNTGNYMSTTTNGLSRSSGYGMSGSFSSALVSVSVDDESDSEGDDSRHHYHRQRS